MVVLHVGLSTCMNGKEQLSIQLQHACSGSATFSTQALELQHAGLPKEGHDRNHHVEQIHQHICLLGDRRHTGLEACLQGYDPPADSIYCISALPAKPREAEHPLQGAGAPCTTVHSVHH